MTRLIFGLMKYALYLGAAGGLVDATRSLMLESAKAQSQFISLRALNQALFKK